MRLNIKSLLMWKISFGGEQGWTYWHKYVFENPDIQSLLKNWCERSRELWLLIWMQDT